MTIEYIHSLQTLRFVEMITAKRFAIKKFQYVLIKEINDIDYESDVSGQNFYLKLKDFLKEEKNNIKIFNAEKYELDDIGFPVQYNKTVNQISMALQWIETRQEDTLSDLLLGSFNGLTNEYSNELPTLGLDNKEYFWGNENSSVSSVLLWSVASMLSETHKPNISDSNLPHFYPFFNAEFSPVKAVESNSIFFNDKGMYLFGDYQYGGHRYFSNPHPDLGQKLTYAEDCSSAVAKAVCLTSDQITCITTSELKEHYKESSSTIYSLSRITSSDNRTLDIEAIQPGNILVFGGHTGTIGKKDGHNITLLEFARDIETEGKKVLGGGIRKYNTEFFQTKSSYVLRPNNLPELKESCAVTNLLGQIEQWLEENQSILDDIPYHQYGSLFTGEDADCKISGDINDV